MEDEIHEGTRRLGHLQDQRSEDEAELKESQEKIEECKLVERRVPTELNAVRVQTSDTEARLTTCVNDYKIYVPSFAN